MSAPDYDRVAYLDQVGTDLQQWAGVYWSFHSRLCSVGFDDDTATHILLGWQEGMMSIEAAKQAALAYRGGDV